MHASTWQQLLLKLLCKPPGSQCKQDHACATLTQDLRQVLLVAGGLCAALCCCCCLLQHGLHLCHLTLQLQVLSSLLGTAEAIQRANRAASSL